jgi:hypothetical protein
MGFGMVLLTESRVVASGRLPTFDAQQSREHL